MRSERSARSTASTPGSFDAGDMGVATSPAQEGRGRAAAEDARRLGGHDKFVELTAEQVRDRCDSPVFGGGILQTTAANSSPRGSHAGSGASCSNAACGSTSRTPVTRFRPDRRPRPKPRAGSCGPVAPCSR